MRVATSQTVVLFGVLAKYIKTCHPERSRTFGLVSGNIANKSKSENCQENFRDLRGFILSFWHKVTFESCGRTSTLFVDPSLRRQAAWSPFFA